MWWSIHRDPSEVRLTPDELRYLTEGDENATSRPPSFAEWRQLFAHRTTWGMIAGFFGNDLYALAVYRLVAILPGARTPHERRAGGDCGRNPLLLRLCRSGSRRLALRLPHPARMDADQRAGNCWSPAPCAAFRSAPWEPCSRNQTRPPSPLFRFRCSLSISRPAPHGPLCRLPLPANTPRRLGSIQNFGGYLGGALAPTVTGLIVQRTGSFSQALLLSAGLTLLSAAAYLLLVREPIPSR